MYSYEIDDIMKNYNYHIPSKIYLDIFKLENTPQLAEVRYNAWSDSFYARTKDNYHWNFTVYKEN